MFPETRVTAICSSLTSFDKEGYISTERYPHPYNAPIAQAAHSSDTLAAAETGIEGSLLTGLVEFEKRNCSLTIVTLPGYRVQIQLIDIELARLADDSAMLEECLDRLDFVDLF